jgi:FlaA1/EpsC-like NDP-sugar epimerase
MGREPVAPNWALLARNLADKVILVIGAAGSIGNELCRQILAEGPIRLVLVEHSGFGLYSIQQELQLVLASLPERLDVVTKVVPLLANVRDHARMLQIFRTYRTHTLYHATAYKHIPLSLRRSRRQRTGNPQHGTRRNRGKDKQFRSRVD